MIHYNSNVHYMVVRSELKNVRFHKMSVNFYMLCVSLWVLSLYSDN